MVDHDARVVRFGSFEVDLQSGELRKNGHKVRVPDQALQILAMLLERPSEVVTREQVQARLWPHGTIVELDNGINSSMRRLRAALNDSAEQPRYIETLPKRGYRFIFPCELAEPAGKKDPRHRPIPRKLTSVAIGAVVFGALLGFGIVHFRTSQAYPITSIAVLPFANATRDPSAEYLSDGISEEIINSLSAARNLKVIARNTAFHFKGQEIDAQKIGRQLGVGALLTGTLQRRGDTVIIQSDLVDVANGAELWGERYQRDIAKLQNLEADIARDIADKLRLRLAGDEQRRLTNRYTENSEAYQLYLKGVYQASGHVGLFKALRPQ